MRIKVTLPYALWLSKYFVYSAKFWVELQLDFDLEEEKEAKQSVLNEIKNYDNKNVA